MSTPKIAIVYHSGYGHTAVVAEAVAAGVSEAGGAPTLLRIQSVSDDFAPLLEQASAADAIIFGSPTYMGDVSAPLKAFFEASSRIWMNRGWQDKLAAGFTNSLSPAGDKSNTLGSIFVFAMQHGMVWTGAGTPPGNANGNSDAAPDAINRFSFSVGLATQSDNAPPEQTPTSGDRRSAQQFGARITAIARKLTA